jgi:predicted peroxiredoxin
MVKTLRSILLALTLALACAAVLADEDKQTIFYNLTTEEAWAAGMALGQANKALEKGYGVVIFLNVRGVFIASKTFQTDTNAAAGMSLQDLLKAAMDKGARVIICPMCMGKAGMTMDDIIDGVVKGGPDLTLPLMTDPDTTVISF